MATAGKFGFDELATGVRFIVVAEPLCAACMHPDEIDYALQRLKEDLDSVAKKMKRRLEARKKESPFRA